MSFFECVVLAALSQVEGDSASYASLSAKTSLMTSAVTALPSFSQHKLQQLAEAKLTYAVRKANAAVAADVTNDTELHNRQMHNMLNHIQHLMVTV